LKPKPEADNQAGGNQAGGLTAISRWLSASDTTGKRTKQTAPWKGASRAKPCTNLYGLIYLESALPLGLQHKNEMPPAETQILEIELSNLVDFSNIKTSQNFIPAIDPIGQAIDIPLRQETITCAAGKSGLDFICRHIRHQT